MYTPDHLICTTQSTPHLLQFYKNLHIYMQLIIIQLYTDNTSLIDSTIQHLSQSSVRRDSGR